MTLELVLKNLLEFAPRKLSEPAAYGAAVTRLAMRFVVEIANGNPKGVVTIRKIATVIATAA